MTPTFLTLYVLACPIVVAGVLFVLVRAFWRELRRARAAGEPII